MSHKLLVYETARDLTFTTVIQNDRMTVGRYNLWFVGSQMAITKLAV